MLRIANGSRRTWQWIAVVGLVVLGIGIARHRGHDSYRDTLATFGVQASTHEAEMAAVVESVLARAPIGSPHTRVIKLLDSLGFARSSDVFERRPAFHLDSTETRRSIVAHWPYQDPLVSLERFFCDRPAVRFSFRFDDAWRLAVADATTARACI